MEQIYIYSLILSVISLRSLTLNIHRVHLGRTFESCSGMCFCCVSGKKATKGQGMRCHDDVRFENFNLHEERQFQAAIFNRAIAGFARTRRRSVTFLP